MAERSFAQDHSVGGLLSDTYMTDNDQAYVSLAEMGELVRDRVMSILDPVYGNDPKEGGPGGGVRFYAFDWDDSELENAIKDPDKGIYVTLIMTGGTPRSDASGAQMRVDADFELNIYRSFGFLEDQELWYNERLNFYDACLGAQLALHGNAFKMKGQAGPSGKLEIDCEQNEYHMASIQFTRVITVGRIPKPGILRVIDLEGLRDGYFYRTDESTVNNPEQPSKWAPIGDL